MLRPGAFVCVRIHFSKGFQKILLPTTLARRA
jgi:hypothetical protein